jgi:hypothetical protein
MSQLEVDKIIPQSGTTLTIGDSGDTITIASGATLVTGGDISTGNNGSIFILDNVGQKSGQITNDGSSSNSLQIDADPDNSGADTYMQFKIDDSEKARIDASGNLLVGKTSTTLNTDGVSLLSNGNGSFTRDNDTPLNVNRRSSNGDMVDFYYNGVSKGTIEVFGGATLGMTFRSNPQTGPSGIRGAQSSIIPYYEGADRNNELDLGSSSTKWKDLYLGGKVYVGSEIRTLSSSSTLSIQGGSTYPGAKIQMAGGQASSNAGTIIFSTDDGNVSNVSERARIDADGNFLVGKTSTTFATAGVNLQPNGRVDITRDGGQSGYFNRTNSDGAIVGFYKDGSAVGAIGARFGGIQIGNSDTGLLFNDGSNEINPTNADGGLNDNLTILGTNNRRFKDLYLGGGVFLGGTGSANKLDDYEEGTWTPALTTSGNTDYSSVGYSIQYGHYTKVGRMVTVQCRLQTNSFTQGSPSGNIRISGLPFQSAVNNIFDYAGTVGFVSKVNFDLSSFGTIDVGASVGRGTTVINLARTRSNNTADSVPATAITASGFDTSITVSYII